MCGIAGFTIGRRDASVDSRIMLESMLDVMRYRGPDERGIAVNDRVAFGHDRLAIMEPQGGRQPRIGPETGNTLVYNGEIYGHRRFDDEIRAAGHQLRDHCDTETLFWLIEMHGVEKAVGMLDGMFAFAYHDVASDTVYLARDAFGQKPLFYAAVGGELVFASEVKALLQHPSLASCSADLGAVSLYMTMEYVPGELTGVSGIRKLLPGHILTFRKGQLSTAAYWRVSDITRKESVDAQQAIGEFDRLINEAVSEQLVADVPLGIFLSGGLDSSLITAVARRHRSDVATFTIQFPQSSFDESAHAEVVAETLATRHTTIALDRQDCVEGIQHLVDTLDQPFADSSMLPTYLLCRETRQHVTVALGGDGADELLLGYPNFRLLRFARLLEILPKRLGRVAESVAGLLPGSHGYMNAAFLLRQLSYGIGLPANLQSIYWMSAVAARDQDELWIEAQPREEQLLERISEQLRPTGDTTVFENCQRHFLEYYLPDDILLKTDRASMYNSLEVRAPFLSSTVANYALSLPHSLIHRGSRGKRILRTVARKYLPASTINRPKHGFALPVSALIRDDLRELVESILLDAASPMYEHLRRGAVKQYWDQHQSGRRDHGKKLWALFMLAVFFRNLRRASSR